MREIVGNAAYDENRDALEQADAVQEAARFIRQMREHAKFSQTVLGERIGVSQERISEMERGNSPEGVSYALLRRVARACGFNDWPNAPAPKSAELSEYVYELDDDSIVLLPQHGGVLGESFGVDEIFAIKEKLSHATSRGKVIDGVILTVNPELGPICVRGISPLKPRALSTGHRSYLSSKGTKV